MSDLYNFIEMMEKSHKISINTDDNTFYVDICTLYDWFVAGEETSITFAFKKDGRFQNLIGGKSDEL